MRELLDNLFDLPPIGGKNKRPQIIPALIGAGAVIGSTVYNAWQQDKMNKSNQEYSANLNKENRDWISEENEKTREMERNALSIRTKDAVNAGFSPLAALQTGAAQVSSPVTPQSFIAPGQAAQMDLSSLASLAGTLESNDTSKKVANIEASTSMRNVDKQTASAQKVAEIYTESANKIAQANIASAEKMADDKNNLDWIKANQSYSLGMAQIQQQINDMQTGVNKDNYLEAVRQDNLTIDGVKKMSADMGFRVHYQRVDISTPEGKARYNQLMSKFTESVYKGEQRMSAWYKQASPEERTAYWQSAKGNTKGRNYSGGLNLKFPSKLEQVFDKIPGQETYSKKDSSSGLGVGVQGQYGTSDGSNESFGQQQMSTVQAIRSSKWFSPNGAPLVFPVPSRGYSAGGKKIEFYQTPDTWRSR